MNELQADYDSPWKEALKQAITIGSIEEFQHVLEQAIASEENLAGES